MMINAVAITSARVYNLSSGGFDSDAALLFTETESNGGYLSTSDKSIISDFFTGTKADGVYSKIINFKGFLGGKAASAALNWVDPEDNNGFNTVWQGELLKDKYFNKYGAEATGNVADRGHEGFIPNTHLTDNLKSAFFWGTHNNANLGSNSVLFGSTGTGSLVTDITINGGGEVRSRIGDNPSNVITSGISNTFGTWYSNRENDSSHKLYRDNVLQDSDVTTITGNSDREFYLFCKNDVGTATQPTKAGVILTFYCVCDGMTDAEAVLLHNRIKTLLIGLGKYVDPIFYDGFDAMSTDDHKFIEGYSIAAQEVGLTPTIAAKLHTLQALHKGGTDGIINLLNPGTFNGVLVNAPAMQSDGMQVERVAVKYANSGMYIDDFTNESEMFLLQYYKNPMVSIGANNQCFGYYVAGNTRCSLQVNLSAGTSSFSTLFGSTGATLYSWDATTEDVHGAIGWNCYNRGTGNKIKMYVKGAFVGSEAISGTNSDNTVLLSWGSRSGTLPHENIIQVGALGEGLTDAEALITSDFVENAMQKLGISALVNPMQTENSTYIQEILADSSITLGSQEAKAKIETIQELVNSGVWAEADLIQFYATIEQSDANIIHDWKNGISFSPAVVNAINRDINGVKGNLINTAINCGYIPSTDNVNVGQDDVSYNQYITEAPSTVGRALFGISDGTKQITFIKQSAASYRIKVNNNTNLDSVADTTKENLLLSIVRNGANYQALEEDGVVVDSNTEVSTGLPTLAFASGCRNNSGSLSTHQDQRAVNMVIGSYALDRVSLSTISNNYLLRLKGYNIPLAA